MTDIHSCSFYCQRPQCIARQRDELRDLAFAVERGWVGLSPEDMPDGEDPMFDHEYFIKGMVWANNRLLEKNSGK